jgi:predicted permease
MISQDGTAVPLDVPLDARVLAFTLVVCCIAAVLFGLAPAVHTARSDLVGALRNQGMVTESRTQSWGLRRMLVIAQVGVSLVLLIGAGLFLRTLQNLRDLDLGFKADEVLQVQIDPQGAGYASERLPELYRALAERVEAIPEVRSAGLSLFGLFSRSQWRAGLSVDGYVPESDGDAFAQGNMVTPGYFATMGIPLLGGRDIEWRDREGAPRVAVVNETFAKHFFAGQSPLGRTFGLDDEPSSRDIEIVGMVGDLMYDDLREETPRMIYLPVLQQLYPLFSVAVRTPGDPAAITTQVRQAIQEVAPDLPILEVVTLPEQVDRSLRQEKLLSKLTGFFGLLALVLASVGLYGVMAYGVTQRTNEIGIRMALGAGRAQVLWMVLRDAAVMVTVGIALGILVALASTRWVSSLLYGLSETDPLTLLSATAVLLAVAIVAGYLPARRAARMDPLMALRYE